MGEQYWAEVTGENETYVIATGDAAPVAEIVAHWTRERERAIDIYTGESLPTARRVDQLMRALDGTLRRTQHGRELVARGSDAGWLEAIRATGAVK
jgi:hypothetical protein